MPLALAIVGVGLTAYGAIKQNQSAKNAAEVDTATANYNAKYDQAMAAQLDLDTQANVRTMRDESEIYLSQQHASYASAGVLANTGSALDAQITNAGRLEQRIQQEWINMNQRRNALYSQARIGRLAGEAQSDSDKASGTLALINGGASIARQLYGAYDSGVFS